MDKQSLKYDLKNMAHKQSRKLFFSIDESQGAMMIKPRATYGTCDSERVK